MGMTEYCTIEKHPAKNRLYRYSKGMLHHQCTMPVFAGWGGYWQAIFARKNLHSKLIPLLLTVVSTRGDQGGLQLEATTSHW
jgi:hypothetical protein